MACRASMVRIMAVLGFALLAAACGGSEAEGTDGAAPVAQESAALPGNGFWWTSHQTCRFASGATIDTQLQYEVATDGFGRRVVRASGLAFNGGYRVWQASVFQKNSAEGMSQDVSVPYSPTHWVADANKLDWLWELPLLVPPLDVWMSLSSGNSACQVRWRVN